MADNIGEIRNPDGTFGKGTSGRPKGALNKASVKVRDAIVKFLEDNVDDIQDSFSKLKPSEKLRFISDILPYATPKLSSIQSENETNVSGGITISWQDPKLPDTDDKGSSWVLQGLQGWI